MLTLADLPPAPAGKTGWPWTEASPPLPPTRPDGSRWPRLSIVTPSYNQAQFLEEAIRSVLLQGYPSLEYMVIDGGSQDGSPAIVRRYEPWLAYAVSERDSGQAAAINKGFARGTGALVGWVNSDDFLLPGAAVALAEAHLREPRAIVLGDVFIFAEETQRGAWLHPHNVTLANAVALWKRDWTIHQSATFVPRALAEHAGWLDESLRYFFDHDWLCRLLADRPRLVYLNRPVNAFRLHSQSKSVGETSRWSAEVLRVIERYRTLVPGLGARRVEAGHALHQASILLSLFHLALWSPRTALSSLGRAARLAPDLLLAPDFWHVAVRVLVPLRLARRMRARRFGTPVSDMIVGLTGR